jgi:TetR/AcrR family transcriptional regulator, transcriptional repressor for nem operon
MVLERGFSATSIDEVIAAAGTTKGGFFHHFPSKAELARALVDQYAAADMALLEDVFARAERLSGDPLQQLLLVVGLLEEAVAEPGGDDLGCLYAAFCYDRELVDEATLDTIAKAVRAWRDHTRELLEQVVERYPPRLPVDLDALADQGLAVLEGAYVLSRALGEPDQLARQLRQFRTYLELLFNPPPT